ncbi:hypothetical protein Tco_0059005 [Tanacetum coccineum]
MAGRGLAEYGRSGRVLQVMADMAGVVPLHLEVPEVVIINVPRHDSPEYDRRDGRVVSRKYSDEPSSRHGRYESSRRTPGIAQV